MNQRLTGSFRDFFLDPVPARFCHKRAARKWETGTLFEITLNFMHLMLYAILAAGHARDESLPQSIVNLEPSSLELRLLRWTLDLEIIRLRSYLGPSLLQFHSLDVPWSMMFL